MNRTLRHGWLKIPGVQDGDRDLQEQMLGLDQALASAKGKTVLDIGCAEGLIAREFVRAGARHVTGLELLEDHLTVAREQCKGLPATFICAEMRAWIEKNPNPQQYDIVLALGIAHKLHQPGTLMTFSARSASEMVVFRGPGKINLSWDGWLKSKFGTSQAGVAIPCHVPTVMTEQGFVEGETLPSCRGERVQYWHRK